MSTISHKTAHRGKDALAIVRKYFPDVTAVRDARCSTKIEVTSKDNATAKRYAHKECAFAVACKRQEHLDGVIISVSTAYLIKAGIATRYRTPDTVGREVTSFDRGSGFAAGNYHLCAPGAQQRLGHISGGHPKKRAKVSKNPQKRYHRTSGIRSSLGSA